MGECSGKRWKQRQMVRESKRKNWFLSFGTNSKRQTSLVLLHYLAIHSRNPSNCNYPSFVSVWGQIQGFPSSPSISISIFNVVQFAQRRRFLLRWCCPLPIQVSSSLFASLPPIRSLEFRKFWVFDDIINHMIWYDVFLFGIAEKGLAPDPLLPPMKSNCASIPWTPTWTTKSPVFAAKLKSWEMYFLRFSPFSFYSLVILIYHTLNNSMPWH